METIIFFDADTQHYRQSIYIFFQKEFAARGFQLKVFYDKNLNQIDGDLFTGIEYNFRNFNNAIAKYNSKYIILFVWLRYKFLLPFMLYQRLKGIKMITWSHGINLQKPDNHLMNNFYYMRQRLAHALIIYSPREKKYIKASHRKLFIANNTLNFHDIPEIKQSKEEIKKRYGLSGKPIVLCVGRMNTNNRKLDYLLDGFNAEKYKELYLVVVGEGVTASQQEQIKHMKNVLSLGAVFDPVKINEIYKMSDIFCMPGAIGLAINHAFYHGLPVVVEDVAQAPEIYYLKEGENGFFFREGDIQDMMDKIWKLHCDKALYEKFSTQARQIIIREASIENMFNGFWEAVNYVQT